MLVICSGSLWYCSRGIGNSVPTVSAEYVVDSRSRTSMCLLALNWLINLTLPFIITCEFRYTRDNGYWNGASPAACHPLVVQLGYGHRSLPDEQSTPSHVSDYLDAWVLDGPFRCFMIR